MSESAASPGSSNTPRAIAKRIAPLLYELETLTQGIGLDGAAHDLDCETTQRLMNIAIRLHAAGVTAGGETFKPSGEGVSTTETVTAISALMAAQDLNTFDLALWQSKLRRS